MAIVSDGLIEYDDDVRFPVVPSKQDNCICNACHRAGRVLKIDLPWTLYRDGKNLITRYTGYWLCEICHKKLIDAMETAYRGIYESD